MRAVKTILSFSFLFLAASIVAGGAEVSNELPDEIKNLKRRQILKSIKANFTSDPEKTGYIPPRNNKCCGKIEA